jgi:predicted MFS family arabinose efflux permease
MSNEKTYFERGFQKRLFLSALAFAVFAAAVIDVMMPLLLTDVAKTFQVPVGTASTISSISAIVGVAVGLLMAVLSVRFKHKPLLLIGVFCISAAALGTFLAPTFLSMQILYSLNGVGSVMIGAMAFALIGEFYPLEKRGKAVGWIVAAGFLAFTIGAPMTGLLVNFGGWRSVMLWFNLPVSIVGLLFAFIVIPSKSIENHPEARSSILAGCRQTLTNKSAAACLIGGLLVSATGVITFFVISFWKSQFELTTSMGSIITMVNATTAAVGGIVAGRLVNRTGRKLTGVAAGFVGAIMVVLTVFMPNLATSWGISIIRVWCFGMLSASFASLTLEQIPKFRGTMMSLKGAFSGVGSFLGITIGGIVLNMYNYQTLGIILGALGFSSITVVLLFAKDTGKKQGPE